MINKHNIDAVIWDFDNTLYRFDQDFIDACNVACAKAAMSMVKGLEFQEALSLAEQSYAKTDFSSTYFLQQYDLDLEELHIRYHANINERIIQICDHTVQSFEKLDLPHVILTHGAKEWAIRALSHLKLKSFFPDHHILALEDFDHERKSSSRKPFEKALALLGTQAQRTAMVEDSPHNLTVAHEMGFQTVLLHHGQVPENKPYHADFMTDNVNTLIKILT